MTPADFLQLLVSIEFPAKYWAWCDSHPLQPEAALYGGQKAEVLLAFRELGVEASYNGRDRSYVIEAETIGVMQWDALFAKQRFGLDFMISGVGSEGRVGSNLAALAYDAKRVQEPGFVRSPFSGPPPYPRPRANDRDELIAILGEFVGLVREIKRAIRARVA